MAKRFGDRRTNAQLDAATRIAAANLGEQTMTTTTQKHDAIADLEIAGLQLAPYRRRGDEGDLDGLAGSIKRHGVIQRLTVRKLGGGGLEIVCGARRSIAATMAGLTKVPCRVRELDDLEAEQVCLSENLDRDDLHPMDEAQSYERQVEQFGYTIDDLVASSGKDARHVRERLKLLTLAPKVRAAYLAGDVRGKDVFKIARLADHAQQVDLLEVAIDLKRGDENESADLLGHGVKHAMRDLGAARFDIADAELVAGAVACSSCPKRTGTQRELFSEIASADDYCLDASCYGSKSDAWAKASKVKVLSKAAAAKEYGYGHLNYGSQYVEADAEAQKFLGNHGSRSKKTLAVALAKDAPDSVFLKTESGELLELYERKEAAAKCKTAGLATTATATRARTLTPQETAANTKARNEAKVSRLTTERAIGAAVDVIGGAEIGGAEVGLEVLAALADMLCHGQKATTAAKRRGFKSRELLQSEMRKKADDTGWLAGLAWELIIQDNTYGHIGPDITRVLLELGVDVGDIEAAAKTEVKAASKKRADSKKAGAKKAAKKAEAAKRGAKNTAKKAAATKKRAASKILTKTEKAAAKKAEAKKPQPAKKSTAKKAPAKR